MTRPDTRHLDTAIAILGGGKAVRKLQSTVIHVYDLGPSDVRVHVRGKHVATKATKAEALADANRRADAIQKLTGKRPTIQES